MVSLRRGREFPWVRMRREMLKLPPENVDELRGTTSFWSLWLHSIGTITNAVNISGPADKPQRLVVILGVTWLGAILAGMFLMLAYANSPGVAAAPPVNWPSASQVPLDRSLPTLVMFVHPHCPCSRASVGELASLMAHCQGRVNARVLFLQPREMPSNWTQTDLWQEAERIPGVTVHRDEDGREARLFRVATSGDTALYDAKGVLLFHGGLTLARGHSGDNPGRDALQALLLGRSAQRTSTPVFGCSLFDCNLPGNP